MIDFDKAMRNTDDRYEAFRLLYAQNTPPEVKKGDKVLVAAGMLGRGYLYIKDECEVIAVGKSSVKVRGKKSYMDDPWEDWIEPCFILEKIAA